MFKRLKNAMPEKTEVPRQQLVIHVENSAGGGFKTMVISNEIYPTFKLLLRDLAEAHNADLVIKED